MPVLWRYALATLPPLAMLIAGALWGGAWGAAALVWLTLLAAGLDHWLSPPAPPAQGTHGPGADALSALLALGHLALLPLAVLALADPGRSLGETVPLFFAAASFLGQVSHPNAHELIHRKSALLRGLGAAVYAAMLFGHHVSAHRLVHHRFVGTQDDPNTPRAGEGFWRFLPRAWAGSWRAGLAQETGRAARRGQAALSLRNPYWIWVGGGALATVLAAQLAGPAGLAWMLALAALAHMQILLSDYIQHYGLHRLPLPSGRIEPVGPHHSWNAPRGFSSYLMLNAPSHSDHHMHPNRPYDVLQTPADAPRLPYSLPIMAMLAVIPPVWRRNMDRRAARQMARAADRIDPARPAA